MPQVHPHDRVLLRPLATLGKPQVSGSAVSFLRRTEYISNANTTSRTTLFHKSQRNNNSAAPRPPKRKSPEPEAGTPEHMKRRIVRGFESARENLKNLSRVRHPSKLAVGKNKGLRVVEAYSVLPDTTAFPDSGTYVTYKFAHPPITHNRDGYDRRLQTSVLKFVGRTAEEEEQYNRSLEAHQRDPETNPKPLNQGHYELYLAENVSIADKMRAKFDLNNPNRDTDDSLLTGPALGDGRPAYSYAWARSYLSTTEYEVEHDGKYDEEITFALDHETKTAWYYPSMLRNRMEPPRRIYTGDERGNRKVDVQGYEFAPVGPSEEFRARMDHFRDNPRYAIDEEEEESHTQHQIPQEPSPSASGSPLREQSVESDGYGREASQERREESEQDAEGDEDE